MAGFVWLVGRSRFRSRVSHNSCPQSKISQHNPLGAKREKKKDKPYSINSPSKVSCLNASRMSGTLLFATLFPAMPGKQQSLPSHLFFNESSKPLCSTECLASSHMSTALNLYIWAATEYSSINGSFVKANCNGSSVDKDTFKPRLKKLAHGFLSYVRKSALLLSGDIAIPIWLR